MSCELWQTWVARRDEELQLRRQWNPLPVELQLVNTKTIPLRAYHERRKIHILTQGRDFTAKYNRRGRLIRCAPDRTITRTSQWTLQYDPDVPLVMNT